MDKDYLEKCLRSGMSTREVEKECGLDHRTISYWINKYSLQDMSRYRKNDKLELNKIDTKEKAYLVGFLLGDGTITENENAELSVSLSDRAVVDFLVEQFGGHTSVSYVLDKAKKRFPRARWSRKIHGIKTIVGGMKKADRHYPIIRNDLERYMIQGFFDADGCITWGRRKDKARLWQKISFSSQYKILLGVQQYIYKHLGIASTIRPKSHEACYVLDFASAKDVIKFINHIYPDDSFIILKRKYLKSQALRLELEENGETAAQAQYRAEPAEQEGVETNGDIAIYLNNRVSIQGVA